MSTSVKNLRSRHIGRKVVLDHITVGFTKFSGNLTRNHIDPKFAKWRLVNDEGTHGVNIFNDETVKFLK